MSYILDALRKADAERERGTVPGIHAQPIFGGTTPLRGDRRALPVWVWIAGALLVLLLIAVSAWAWFAGGSAAPVTPQAASPAAAPTVAAPAPAPVPLAAPPGTAPATSTPMARPPVTSAAPKPVAVAPVRPAAAPASSASANASDALEENRIYAQKDLPDDIRRQLPAVNVGGSMYSANKADRLLIINGQVLHEGDSVAPGLMLEQIRLKGAVLAFKGYRYTIAF